MPGKAPIPEAIRKAIYVEWKSNPDIPYHVLADKFKVHVFSVKKFIDKYFEIEREEIRKEKMK